jgi:hypothetical protein
MNFQKHGACTVIFLALFLAAGGLVSAEIPEDKQEKTATQKDGHLRTSDLPKPLQEIGDIIQRAGNEVGKGISKASKALREAPEKTEKNEKKDK